MVAVAFVFTSGISPAREPGDQVGIHERLCKEQYELGECFRWASLWSTKILQFLLVYHYMDELLRIPSSISTLLLTTTYIKFQKGWKYSWHMQFHHSVLQTGVNYWKKMESARGRQMSGIFSRRTTVGFISLKGLYLSIFSITKFWVLTFSGNPSYCRAPTSFQSEMFCFYFKLTAFYVFLTDHWTSTMKSLPYVSITKF